MKNIGKKNLIFGIHYINYFINLKYRNKLYGVDMSCMRDWVLTEPLIERINEK
jgi:hypothetical protein